MFLIKSFIIIAINLCFNSAEEWSYRDQSVWEQRFESCAGRRQSPININTEKLKRNSFLGLNVENYDISYTNANINNNGHTVRITLNSKDPIPKIRGSAVGAESDYQFVELHLHWGINNFEGTEHSIDGVFGAAELHFVHFNEKYGNIANARQHSDGIVVLTTLSQLSRFDNDVLEPIITALPRVSRYNSSDIIDTEIVLESLLPKNKELFFRYKGSLTTPPCSEAVTFIIMAQTIPISAYQLSQLRRLRGKSHRIVSNTRKIQHKFRRIVEISSKGGNVFTENDSDY